MYLYSNGPVPPDAKASKVTLVPGALGLDGDKEAISTVETGTAVPILVRVYAIVVNVSKGAVDPTFLAST